MRIWIQHFRQCWYGSGWFWWPKIKEINSWKFGIKFFYIKNCSLPFWSLGLRKGCTRYRRSFQPSKANIQHFKTCKFFTFFYFCGSFLPLWIQLTKINADPDPLHWYKHKGIQQNRWGNQTLKQFIMKKHEWINFWSDSKTIILTLCLRFFNTVCPYLHRC